MARKSYHHHRLPSLPCSRNSAVRDDRRNHRRRSLLRNSRTVRTLAACPKCSAAPLLSASTLRLESEWKHQQCIDTKHHKQSIRTFIISYGNRSGRTLDAVESLICRIHCGFGPRSKPKAYKLIYWIIFSHNFPSANQTAHNWFLFCETRETSNDYKNQHVTFSRWQQWCSMLKLTFVRLG